MNKMIIMALCCTAVLQAHDSHWDTINYNDNIQCRQIGKDLLECKDDKGNDWVVNLEQNDKRNSLYNQMRIRNANAFRK